MSPLRRHKFVCFMAKSFFGGIFGNQFRRKGSDPYSAWMKYVVCIHLYIPLKISGAGVYSPRSYGDEFVFFYVAAKAIFVCFMGKGGFFRP